jgi:hypothetical protein
VLWFFLRRSIDGDKAMRIPSLLPVLVVLSSAAFAQISREPETQTPPPTPEQVKAAAAMPFRNPSLPIEQRVDDLVSRMTLEEKVSQTIDRAPAIPRLDIHVSAGDRQCRHMGCAAGGAHRRRGFH